jgi:hypothetical protein
VIQEATRPGAPAGPATSSSAAECFAPVRDLPGLSHACLLEPGGHVLAEIGADEGAAAAAVLAWGRRAVAVATDRGRTLDDLIVTTDAAYHLVRAIGGLVDGPWIYLRVRRDGGNLALARRQLAAITTAASAPAPPAVRSSRGSAGVPIPRRNPATTPALPAAASVPTAPPSRASPPAASPAPVPWARPPAERTTATPVAVPALPAPRSPAGPAAMPARPQPPAEPARRRTSVRDSAGVLTQRWRTDPETLRRVLAGLLRLGPTS